MSLQRLQRSHKLPSARALARIMLQASIDQLPELAWTILWHPAHTMQHSHSPSCRGAMRPHMSDRLFSTEVFTMRHAGGVLASCTPIPPPECRSPDVLQVAAHRDLAGRQLPQYNAEAGGTPLMAQAESEKGPELLRPRVFSNVAAAEQARIWKGNNVPGAPCIIAACTCCYNVQQAVELRNGSWGWGPHL